MIQRVVVTAAYCGAAFGLLWFTWAYAGVVEQGVLAATAGLGLLTAVYAGVSAKG